MNIYEKVAAVHLIDEKKAFEILKFLNQNYNHTVPEIADILTDAVKRSPITIIDLYYTCVVIKEEFPEFMNLRPIVDVLIDQTRLGWKIDQARDGIIAEIKRLKS